MKPEYIFLAAIYGLVVLVMFSSFLILMFKELKKSWPKYRRKIKVKFAKLKIVRKDP